MTCVISNYIFFIAIRIIKHLEIAIQFLLAAKRYTKNRQTNKLHTYKYDSVTDNFEEILVNINALCLLHHHE